MTITVFNGRQRRTLQDNDMLTTDLEGGPPHKNYAVGGEAQRRVLLIEDEPESASNTAMRLRENGWSADIAQDGLLGLTLATEERFDVIIVDRMLPGLDGLSLVGRLRARDVRTPVLFVTAMGAVADRVAGLEGGGDDYLVKPFSFEELRARLQILARRGGGQSAEAILLSVGVLTLDRLKRAVTVGSRPVDLLPLEYRLLEFFMLNLDHVVTRSMLLQRVWGFKFDPQTNIVETHISRLRSKIDPDGAVGWIKTIRGAGYLMATA